MRRAVVVFVTLFVAKEQNVQARIVAVMFMLNHTRSHINSLPSEARGRVREGEEAPVNSSTQYAPPKANQYSRKRRQFGYRSSDSSSNRRTASRNRAMTRLRAM